MDSKMCSRASALTLVADRVRQNVTSGSPTCEAEDFNMWLPEATPKRQYVTFRARDCVEKHKTLRLPEPAAQHSEIRSSRLLVHIWPHSLNVIARQDP